MKCLTRSILLTGALLAMGVPLVPLAMADVGRPNVQRAQGGFIASSSTANTQVSGSGGLVTGVSLTCGSTACSMGLYDAATGSAPTNTQGVWEHGAAANTTAYFSFKDAPIRFATGILAAITGAATTGNGAVVFTEQNVP